MRAVIACVVLAVLVLGGITLYCGDVPDARDVIRTLASRPEVGTKFSDPDHDRFDATVFLFTALIMTPLAGLALMLVASIAAVMVEATVMPVGRRFGVPDGLMHAAVVLAVAGAAYAEAEVWVPRSLRLLGLLARAYLIAST